MTGRVHLTVRANMRVRVRVNMRVRVRVRVNMRVGGTFSNLQFCNPSGLWVCSCACLNAEGF